ncbi:Tetraspanin-33 [Amphibalanus amphitrite]|uniref:Tetraspanin-33 n=1 Tax=Amphibalanus amphitrite TaxID=1232801 RepID=A0A6A4X8H4_AMPAM|nr:Tetraspanin-33 [Amphibalanus amphitrite]
MKPPKISKAVKYGLAFFNGVFWILSLLLIVAGYYSITSADTAAIKTTNVFALVLNISVLLLLIGVVMFVITSASYISGVVNRDLPQKTVATYRDDANMQNLLDFLQRHFHCCGVSVAGYLDWSANAYFNCSPSNPSVERCSVPWSCCLHPDNTPIRDTTCGRGVQKLTAVAANEKVHTDGCVSAVVSSIEEHGHIVGASCIAVGFAQGAALYQATRISVLLERMSQKKRKAVKEAPLFSVARLVLLVGLLTGSQSGAEEPDEEEGGKRRKRKRRNDEDGDDKRAKKRRKKDERDRRQNAKGRNVLEQGDVASAEDESDGSSSSSDSDS